MFISFVRMIIAGLDVGVRRGTLPLPAPVLVLPRAPRSVPASPSPPHPAPVRRLTYIKGTPTPQAHPVTRRGIVAIPRIRSSSNNSQFWEKALFSQSVSQSQITVIIILICMNLQWFILISVLKFKTYRISWMQKSTTSILPCGWCLVYIITCIVQVFGINKIYYWYLIKCMQFV